MKARAVKIAEGRPERRVAGDSHSSASGWEPFQTYLTGVSRVWDTKVTQFPLFRQGL